MKQQVKTVCTSCGGTGLYEGMCEEKGHPVVCISCNGTGCKTIYYDPFIKRKIINGVKGVRLSIGTFISTDVEAKDKEVSYEEFLEGKLKYE